MMAVTVITLLSLVTALAVLVVLFILSRYFKKGIVLCFFASQIGLLVYIAATAFLYHADFFKTLFGGISLLLADFIAHYSKALVACFFAVFIQTLFPVKQVLIRNLALSFIMTAYLVFLIVLHFTGFPATYQPLAHAVMQWLFFVIVVYASILVFKYRKSQEDRQVRGMLTVFLVVMGFHIVLVGIQEVLLYMGTLQMPILEEALLNPTLYIIWNVLLFRFLLLFIQFKAIPVPGLNVLSMAPEAASKLTPREMEIAGLLAVGCSNHSIGERLFISELTVKTHVRNIYGKLGIKNRVELLNLFSQRNTV